jgi:hypothetical protein
MVSNDSGPTFCDRCLRELTSGRGEYFVVRIEAVADPSPPVFDEAEVAEVCRTKIAQLMEKLEHVTEQEANDQVHRRLTLFLCNRCFASWIESPVSPG